MPASEPRYRLYPGDCREVLGAISAESIDAIVTDPPYELTAARPGGRSAATRGAVLRGFMGLEWDATGIAYDPALWRACLRVLKPGAHLLAFGGTRTAHRMVCAIEDAGFEIRDSILWLYGSGFPKSKNLTGERQGWGSALKPAHEPIVLARKPLAERTLEANVARYGTGALNIDACRVPTSENLSGGDCSAAAAGVRHPGWARPWMEDRSAVAAHAARCRDNVARAEVLGRWPANVIHDGSTEVLAAFPEAPGQCADAKLANELKTSRVYGAMRRERGDEPSANSENTGAVGFKMRPGTRRLDAGTAARFFYCAKASRADRGEGNSHPTVKPTALMAYLCRLVTPPGGMVLDPFTGSGSTGVAAVREGLRFIGIEAQAAYLEIARQRIALEHGGQMDLLWA
jgi:site-specific DNA-methyltransferase (adenine-specific)